MVLIALAGGTLFFEWKYILLRFDLPFTARCLQWVGAICLTGLYSAVGELVASSIVVPSEGVWRMDREGKTAATRLLPLLDLSRL